MTGERVVRRLAAILAADVAGYSRLMGRDEHGTLTRLKAHRTERLEPILARHGGRLVKLTGDGALVEFPSAVDALSAAIAFQQAVTEANHDQPEETRIVFRMMPLSWNSTTKGSVGVLVRCVCLIEEHRSPLGRR